MFKFLAGLKVEFDEVRGIIGRQPLPPLGEVFAEVRWEDSRRNVMLRKNTLTGPIENSALLSAAVAVSHFPNNQHQFDDKPRVWCDYCNKPCHTHETCWKLHSKLEE